LQPYEGQILELKKYGCTEICRENTSGANRERPQFKAVLNRVGKGDTLVVVRIDRLARSPTHLLDRWSRAAPFYLGDSHSTFSRASGLPFRPCPKQPEHGSREGLVCYTARGLARLDPRWWTVPSPFDDASCGSGTA
jgi:hypothetical protein